MSIQMSPERCPRCNRPARFCYQNEEAARRKAPLCWGMSDSDCPGFGAYAAEVVADRPAYIGDREFAAAAKAAGSPG